ncbi:MAG TPA: CBS domain-containing protein, partial [Anaeromyxobacteraceae bacterium]
AADLLDPRFEATFPDEPLERVLERITRQSCERIPVLKDRESRKLDGTVSRRDILGVYARERVAGRGERS